MDRELTDRIEALEARDEISRLIARYGPAVDDHEYEALAEMYTSDAVLTALAAA